MSKNTISDRAINSASEATRRLNPHLFGTGSAADTLRSRHPDEVAAVLAPVKKRIRQGSKPLMNKTERRASDYLLARGVVGIMEQAITLRLDPPFKSYRPDLAYLSSNGLVLVEVKGPHRFRKAGIAKVALAAKTYPQFRFELYDWIDGLWKVSVMSP